MIWSIFKLFSDSLIKPKSAASDKKNTKETDSYQTEKTSHSSEAHY